MTVFQDAVDATVAATPGMSIAGDHRWQPAGEVRP
jgi:hypothetical protein